MQALNILTNEVNSPVYRVSCIRGWRSNCTTNIDLSNTYLLLLSNIAELRGGSGSLVAILFVYLVNNLDIFPRKVEKYEY